MIKKTLLNILVCPVSQDKLALNMESMELVCQACSLSYPIIDGIPVLIKSLAHHYDSQDKCK